MLIIFIKKNSFFYIKLLIQQWQEEVQKFLEKKTINSFQIMLLAFSIFNLRFY